MKRLIHPILALFTACLLLIPTAGLAATPSIDGTVVNIGEETISSPWGGLVDTVPVSAGATVSAGSTLATLKTTTVYAERSGTIRLFGDVGDSAEMITALYGAIAYIEPVERYTVSISTKTANTAEENKFVHPGDTVYLRSQNNQSHTGKGQITTVSGGSFTVLITEGTFDSSESVNAFRDPGYLTTTRLGKGSVSLADPVAVTGEGILAAVNVKNGASIKKGAALFETLEGTYAGKVKNLGQIVAPADGVISSLSVSRGTSISANAAVCTFYPDNALRIQASVSESDLSFFMVGTKVKAEFTYLQDGALTVTGTVESVSRLGLDSTSDEASYSVIIQPDTDTDLLVLSYGAHAVVTPADK